MNQLKAGAILSYVNMGVHIILGLIYVPLLLKYLTIGEFGLYQLIGSIAAYLSVMDFGLTSTITRFYSQQLELKNKNNQENVLAVSLIIYTAISLLVVIVGYWILNSVDALYGESLSKQEVIEAKKILVLLIVNVAITIPANINISILTSHEKFVFLRLVTISRSIVNPILAVVVLTIKAEALSVVIVQVFLNFAVIIANWWYSKFRLKIKIRIHNCNPILFKSMFAFSFFVFLGAIVDRIYWKTGQVVLGAVSGTESVAIFSISILLINYYMQFSSAINGVFLPRLSRLAVAKTGMNDINILFIKVGRIQFVILGLILTGFIIFGKAFLILWIGHSMSDAYQITLIIMIPLTLPLIQNLGILILQAKNKHSFRSIVYISIALLNLMITIPLAKEFGGFGCAIATGFCVFLGNGVVINLYYNKIGIKITNFFKEISKLFFLVLVALFIGGGLLINFRIGRWEELAISGSAYLIIYCLIMLFFGINEEEKRLLSSLVYQVKKTASKYFKIL